MEYNLNIQNIICFDQKSTKIQFLIRIRLREIDKNPTRVKIRIFDKSRTCLTVHQIQAIQRKCTIEIKMQLKLNL